MHVNVEMGYFLKRRRTDGVPQADAFMREGVTYSASDAGDRRHQCGARRLVQVANVRQMRTGNDQHMTRMKLAQVDERHRQRILVDDVGESLAPRDCAEDA